MLKYFDVMETFTEVPDKWTLCINIGDCPCHCKGCHSPWLWDTYKPTEDSPIKSKELNTESLKELLAKHKGINCVAFMGGDSDPFEVYKLCKVIQFEYPDIERAWYSGRKELPDFLRDSYEGQKLQRYNYIKLGPYIEKLGGLDNPNTNQKFYEVMRIDKSNNSYVLKDITNKFWIKNE